MIPLRPTGESMHDLSGKIVLLTGASQGIGADAGFTVNIHSLDRRRPHNGWTAPDFDQPLRGLE